jgi:hypothetical protein
MRRVCIALAVLVALGATPASAKVVGISASPNPATLGHRVRHTVEVGVYGPLEVWVSASGFRSPGMGTLPSGSWSYECCPAQTAGTPAWHYRSYSFIGPGSYRFGAASHSRGTFLSTAAAGGTSAGVWIRIV